MPTLTKDEQIVKLDRQLEQLINTTLKQNDSLTRAEAVKLLAQRAVRKATQRPMRPLVEPQAITTV
jgi:hypothetical protein